jgi:hypothetical protein
VGAAPYRILETESLARRATLREEIEQLGKRHRALVEYGLAVDRDLAAAKAHVRFFGALTGLLVAALAVLVELAALGAR